MLKAFHRTGKRTGIIPPEMWPHSIQHLEPRHVRATQFGVFLQEGFAFFRQKGLWVNVSFLPEIASGKIPLSFGDIFVPYDSGVIWVSLKPKKARLL